MTLGLEFKSQFCQPSPHQKQTNKQKTVEQQQQNIQNLPKRKKQKGWWCQSSGRALGHKFIPQHCKNNSGG
jgi:hypothetical protein